MFAIARFVVRHKIAAAALVAAGVFFSMPGPQEEQGPVNPWSAKAQASTVSASADESFVDEMIDGGIAYLDEHDLNPMEKADETVSRFEGTASAYSQANR